MAKALGGFEAFIRDSILHTFADSNQCYRRVTLEGHKPIAKVRGYVGVIESLDADERERE